MDGTGDEFNNEYGPPKKNWRKHCTQLPLNYWNSKTMQLNVPPMPPPCRPEQCFIGEFLALLVIVRLPAKFPVVKGVNVARTAVRLPGPQQQALKRFRWP